MATEIRDALIVDATYEIEFAFGDGDDGTAGEPRWYALSVRGAGDDPGLEILDRFALVLAT